MVSPGWRDAYARMTAQPQDIELLRMFRDHLLAPSVRGKRWTDQLYLYEKDALGMFFRHPRLLLLAKQMIDANRQAIQEALNGRQGQLHDLAAVLKFLDEFGAVASPDLKNLADDVQRQIRRYARMQRPIFGISLTGSGHDE